MPLAPASRAGVVWIHHMPGYDRETKELVRRLAVAGYNAVCPNLYSREAPGADPDDAAATVRAAGGVPDDRLVGDVADVAQYLGNLDGADGKTGVIVHCWGAGRPMKRRARLQLDRSGLLWRLRCRRSAGRHASSMKPILGLVYTDLSCPLLGLFGKEDLYPSPEAVAKLDAELNRLGKDQSFTPTTGLHTLLSVDGGAYREAAIGGWRRIDDFFAKHLKR